MQKRNVTLGAVVARINRKLRAEGTVLRKTRGDRALFDLGDFYELDVGRNIIMSSRIDPEALARDLGVLAGHELVVQ